MNVHKRVFFVIIIMTSYSCTNKLQPKIDIIFSNLR